MSCRAFGAAIVHLSVCPWQRLFRNWLDNASFAYDHIIEKDETIDSILLTVINITDEVANRQQLEQSREELLSATQDLAEVNLRLNMAI